MWNNQQETWLKLAVIWYLPHPDVEYSEYSLFKDFVRSVTQRAEYTKYNYYENAV